MIQIQLEDLGSTVPTVATIGFFDGVHIGHRSIIDRVVHYAGAEELRSVVVTFDPHPQTVLAGRVVPLLTSIEEKATILAGLGVDALVVVPFTHELSILSPREFLKEIMVERIGTRHLVVGYNHAIGKDASGSAEMIESIGNDLGFSTEIVGPTIGSDRAVSSSVIRRLLSEEGDVGAATSFLGRPYSIDGMVVHGDGRGRQLGFPTANLQPTAADKLLPSNGVYAVKVDLTEDRKTRRLDGIMNVGVRPTLTNARERVLEVHLFDFDGDLYGQRLRVHFQAHIRTERKFDGPESLKQQIRQDIVDCIRIQDELSYLD